VQLVCGNFWIFIICISFYITKNSLDEPRRILRIVNFLLLAHVHAWRILAIVTGIFLASILTFRYYHRKSAFLLIAVLVSSAIVDVIRTTVIGSLGEIESDLVVAQPNMGLDRLSVRW